MDQHIYTMVRKIDSECEAAVQHKELSLVFSDDPDGWNGGRELQKERETAGADYPGKAPWEGWPNQTFPTP